MTVEELKEALLNKEYPEQVQITTDQLVFDIPRFLSVQFLICELWDKKDITKCPAYYRLIKFYETTTVTV